MKKNDIKANDGKKLTAELKFISFSFALSLILLLILSTTVVTAISSSPDPEKFKFPQNNIAPAGPYSTDATVKMLGAKEVKIRKEATEVGPATATHASPAGDPANIGDVITFRCSDMGTNIDYNENFVVLMKGIHGIILIEKAAYDNYRSSSDEYIFPNPNRVWRDEDRISTSQLKYLLNQFDTVIYPNDTANFGQPLSRGGEGQKTWILIHNIRDQSYYDPSQNTYIAGYFSASEDATNNKNMIHVDAYDWTNRVGPNAEQPFLYEGVFAHEFKHLIQFDMNPKEEDWVDEGTADLAMHLCGYGHPSGHIAYYMVYHPMVSLINFGGGLEDYGANYLFQLYLYEHYGGSKYTNALERDQSHGIEGIQKTLAGLGYKDTFDNIFDSWTIANYLNDIKKGDGKYGYYSLQIGSKDTWGYSIEYSLNNFWWGSPSKAPFTVSIDLLSGIEPKPYTAQYFRFNNDNASNVSIQGQAVSGVPAYSGKYEWYSGSGTWAWRNFYQTFDIPTSGAALHFNTNYDIEKDWDYGYVEVYDRNTGEWYTLASTGTVNNVAHPQVNPNTPSGREPNDYYVAGRWHAFTGNSGGWIPVTMDLSQFAGHKIDLYFTTWQDGGSNHLMMFVDDIKIPEIGFSDNVESDNNGWTSTGWYITDGLWKNGLSETTIDTKWVPTTRYPDPAGNRASELNSIRQMSVDSTQSGVDNVPATPTNSGRVQVAIVTNHANHVLPSSYVFNVGK